MLKTRDMKLAWMRRISEYATANPDVIAVYCRAKDEKHIFIIVTKQVVGDMALRHNDFCFKLFDEYESIFDFMVLDQEEFDSMKDAYDEFFQIY